MKRLILFLAVIAMVATTFAQQLNYQAVVRDAHQQLVVNTPVKATFVVNFASGKTYTTTTNGKTNAYGLLSVYFGDESLNLHTWKGATLSVTLKNADNESEVYIDNETKPISSVPYAMMASDTSLKHFMDINNYADSSKVCAFIDGSERILTDSLKKMRYLSMQRDTMLSQRIDVDYARLDSLRDSLRANMLAIVDTAASLRDLMKRGDDTLQHNIDTLSAHIRAAIKLQKDKLKTLSDKRSNLSKYVDSTLCANAGLTDYDGNTYKTVQIGKQCWMAENLRTTKYADGTTISEGSSTSTTYGYWYYPNGSSSNEAIYGLLYNWKAVMRNSASSEANPSGVQGICPTGWHVPSNAEWTQLTDYVSSQSEYQCGGTSTDIAKALASTTGWKSSSTACHVGNNPSSNNATGFSVAPAGLYDGSYSNFGSYAFFWSATEYFSNYAYYRYLYYGYAYVLLNNGNNDIGLSVRCLRD